jgi:TP901 family phage tail tape measure protein
VVLRGGILMAYGGSIKLQGESEYRRALQNITQNLKEVAAQMKLTSATYVGNDKSIQALTTRSTELNNKLGLQKDKVVQLKKQYEVMNQQYQTNTTKHNELLRKYDDEKTKLETIGKTLGTTSAEYTQQGKVVEALAKGVKASTANQDANAKSLSNMGIQIKNTEADVLKTETAISKLNQQMSKSSQATKEASTAYGALKNSISIQEAQLKALKTNYANIVLEQGKNSQSAQTLAKEIDSLSRKLQSNKDKMANAEKAANKLDKSLGSAHEGAKKASEGFTVLKGALANITANGAMTAVRAMKELASSSIEVGMKFDTGMSKVKAISGATGAEFSQLRDKAKEMGATTKFTATESAEAFKYMAMAGWKTEDMLNGIGGVLNLAAASGEDLAQTSDIVTDALTAMGYSAGDAGRLADVMAAASSNANTNVGMMGHTFQYAAPILGALKYSMEDAAVAIGLMANAGIKADKAGTALRSILTRLSAPPKECADAMQALGISIKNADGTMKPLNQVIQELRSSFSKLSEAEKTQYAKALAGQEAMSGLLAIVNAAPSDYNKLTKAVEKSNGAAKEMADTMLDNAEGGMTLLKSNVEGVQIALYRKFEPALRKGIDMLNGLTNAARFVVDHSREFTAATVAMAAGVGGYVAYTTALKVMADGWKSLELVQKAVAASQKLVNLAMSTSTLGLLVGGLSAAAGAFVALKMSTDQETEAQKQFDKEMAEQSESIKRNTDAWNQLVQSQQNAVNAGMSEISNYQSLYNELQNIVDANGKVKAGYEARASFITDTLSKALGIEIKNIDGVIQNYGKLKESIEEVMKKKKAQILLDKQETLYKEAISKQTEELKKFSAIQDQLTEKVNKRKEAEEEYKTLSEELNKALLSGNSALVKQYEDEINGSKKKIAQLDHEKNVVQQDYDEQKNLLSQYAYNIGQYEKNMAFAHAGEFDKMKDVNWQFVQDYQKAGDAEKAALEDQIRYTEDHLNILREKKQQSGKDIYNSQIAQDEQQLAQLKESLKKYNAATDSGLNETTAIWKSNLGNQLSEITGKNVEFKSDGAGNVQAYIDGVSTGDRQSASTMAQLVSNTINEISKRKMDATTAGEYLIDGLNSGIGNPHKQSSVFGTITNFGISLLNKLRNSLQEHSPSKATEVMGVFLLGGLGIGVSKKAASVLKQVDSFGKSVINTLNGSLATGVSFNAMDSITNNIPRKPKLVSSNMKNVQQPRNNNLTYENGNNITLVEAFKTALSEMTIEMDD